MSSPRHRSFLSTAGEAPAATLAEAVRHGLAPDGGLYLPRELPPLPPSFFARLGGMELAESASRVAEHLLGADLEPAVLREIVSDTLSFPIPLVRLTDRIRVLELFHGPTLAFKDVGARFLARLMARTRSGERAHSRAPLRQDPGHCGDDTLTILVATSGDTGGAVARAFFGVAGTRVAILYPRGKVSPLQERQFTTLGGNVRAFAVDGTFDDCQRLVKEAFVDRELQARLALTSANSINVGRLLPQIFYYFHAAAQLAADERRRPLLFSTPSGNFGNLAAGLIAKRLGLACRFIAATNVNDVVPEYLESGVYSPRPSARTISNAMDVGDPSNFARILHLYAQNLGALRDDLTGRRYDDAATRRAIAEVDSEHGYLMDPHTAVGYLALRDHLAAEDSTSPRSGAGETLGIVLSTAHPAKFGEVVEPVIGRQIELPPQLAERLEEPVLSEPLASDVAELKRRLLDWE